MTLALAFWILMLIWLVFGLSVHYWPGSPPWVGTLLLFILFLLLGWKTFGSPIHG